jgi:hypothetical protein
LPGKVPQPKFDIVLPAGDTSPIHRDLVRSFVKTMYRELHANEEFKGGREAWQSAEIHEHIAEILYHTAKLAIAVQAGNRAGISEYSADVANHAMFIADAHEAIEKDGGLPDDVEDWVGPEYPEDGETDFDKLKEFAEQTARRWLGQDDAPEPDVVKIANPAEFKTIEQVQQELLANMAENWSTAVVGGPVTKIEIQKEIAKVAGVKLEDVQIVDDGPNQGEINVTINVVDKATPPLGQVAEQVQALMPVHVNCDLNYVTEDGPKTTSWKGVETAESLGLIEDVYMPKPEDVLDPDLAPSPSLEKVHEEAQALKDQIDEKLAAIPPAAHEKAKELEAKDQPKPKKTAGSILKEMAEKYGLVQNAGHSSHDHSSHGLFQMLPPKPFKKNEAVGVLQALSTKEHVDGLGDFEMVMDVSTKNRYLKKKTGFGTVQVLISPVTWMQIHSPDPTVAQAAGQQILADMEAAEQIKKEQHYALVALTEGVAGPGSAHYGEIAAEATKHEYPVGWLEPSAPPG